MFSYPGTPVVNHHTVRFIIGFVALSLAGLTNLFASAPLESISAAYHEDGWSRDILVGFLLAVAALLLTYNGDSRPQMIMSKVAAFAAFGVAMFPCVCGNHPQIVPYVHAVSAFVMFSALAIFCRLFYRKAKAKGHPEALMRATFYAISAITIMLSIAGLFIDWISGGALSALIPRFVFIAEAAALLAFGVSWLVASRAAPVITNRDERISLFE